MNKISVMKTGMVFALFLFVFATSCKDEIDKHYDTDTSVNPGYNLMELIEQEADLSIFASMLKQTKYDEVLRRTQAFTVWAPVNQALSQVDLQDSILIRSLVNNHIARFTHSASGALNKKLYMLNAKHISFKQSGDTYYFGDAELLRPNLAASNGILHTIGQFVPFKKNIWEYLEYPELDSIRKYLYSFSERTFMPELSTIIDINTEGLSVYDSVFQLSNVMWNTYSSLSKGIGALNEEDSIYTMILPNNEAWIKAYNKISPYYLGGDKDSHPYPKQIDSLQRSYTQFAIVKDLVFRNKCENPGALGANDSLVSTQRSVFYDPAYLFKDAVRGEVSNGLVYTTSEMYHKPWESWHETVLVEAEYTTGRDDTDRNVKKPVLTIEDKNSTSISNKAYIEVIATGPGVAPGVTFSIPKTLAASYNIYCVFVPFDDKKKKTRIQYQISESRWQYSNGRWNKSNKTLKSGSPANNVTSPTEMTKMLLVSGLTFPYANLDEADPMIKIKVMATKKTDEFVNDMRIDCLLLEPVEQ